MEHENGFGLASEEPRMALSITGAILYDVLAAVNAHGEKPLACRVAALEAALGIARADLEAARDFEERQLVEEFDQDDPWTDAVLVYVQGKDSVRPAEVLRYAIRGDVDQWTHQDAMRVASILRAAGWKCERRRCAPDGQRRMVYVAPHEPEETIQEWLNAKGAEAAHA